jgi:hypothetical protein
MGLFSKKPGGTFFGNLLRGIGGAVSSAVGLPGLLGSGANKIELGQTKTNAELYAEAAAASGQAGSTVAGVLTGQIGATNNNTVMYMFLGFIGFIGVLLIAFKDKLFGNPSSRHNHY